MKGDALPVYFLLSKICCGDVCDVENTPILYARPGGRTFKFDQAFVLYERLILYI